MSGKGVPIIGTNSWTKINSSILMREFVQSKGCPVYEWNRAACVIGGCNVMGTQSVAECPILPQPLVPHLLLVGLAVVCIPPFAGFVDAALC